MGLSAVALGCLPALPSLEGKACDDAHPCGDGYRCAPSQCRGGPPDGGELVVNGDFEAGAGLTGWYEGGDATIAAQQSVVHGGQWAGRASATTTGNSFGINGKQPTTRTISAGTTYCAQGFLHRGTVPPATRLRMFLRFWTSGGGFEDHEMPASADAGWQELRTSATAQAPNDFTATVRFSGDTTGGSEFYVDDVKAWRDDGFVCTASM